MMTIRCDAAIVGAGPAGSSAAITLARRGAHVALIDSGGFPRHKLCGEFLSPECAGELERLGVRLDALNPMTVTSARFSSPAGHTADIHFPQKGWGLSRRALDAALVQAAVSGGAELYAGTTVTRITGSLREGLCLEATSETGPVELRARLVIAAHGRRGALDRALGRSFMRQPHPFVALKRHFAGPGLDGREELHAFPGGYCGLGAVEEGRVNVCLLVREPVFRAASGAGPDRIQSFIRWMVNQNPHLAGWLAEAEPVDDDWLSIAQVPFVNKGPTIGDVLAAGDASALIAPLAGNGIAMALQSGVLAGQRGGEFLEGTIPSGALARRYAREWTRAFEPRLRLGRWLQELMLRPEWFSPALRLVHRFPALGLTLMNRTRHSTMGIRD